MRTVRNSSRRGGGACPGGFLPWGCLVPGGVPALGGAWSRVVPGPGGCLIGGCLVQRVPGLGGLWSGGCLVLGVPGPGGAWSQGVSG